MSAGPVSTSTIMAGRVIRTTSLRMCSFGRGPLADPFSQMPEQALVPPRLIASPVVKAADVAAGPETEVAAIARCRHVRHERERPDVEARIGIVVGGHSAELRARDAGFDRDSIPIPIAVRGRSPLEAVEAAVLDQNGLRRSDVQAERHVDAATLRAVRHRAVRIANDDDIRVRANAGVGHQRAEPLDRETPDDRRATDVDRPINRGRWPDRSMRSEPSRAG